MKKLILAILTLTCFIQTHAQQELIDVGYWKLHYMEVDGITHNVPQDYPVGSYSPGITFSETSSQFYEVNAKIVDNSFLDSNPPTIIEPSSFTIIQPDITLGFCEYLCELEDLYLSTVLAGDGNMNRVFDYEIIDASNGNKRLIITTAEGNIAVHGNYSLSIANFNKINFTMSPNPSKGIITINSSETLEKITLHSISGQLLKEETQSTSLDVSQYDNGIYFVTVAGNGTTKTKKLIKI